MRSSANIAAARRRRKFPLRRDLNTVKRAQFPWMFDVTKCAVQAAIIDLGRALRAFFEGRTRYPVRKRIVVADRWYPSSKTCSCCGVIKETLALAERTFRCDDCDFAVGRDLNAARNLAGLAASSAVSAGREARSGANRKARVKRASVKQQPKPHLPSAA